jgi:TRAP-type C4-dicarboxylate transport system permease small subunit
MNVHSAMDRGSRQASLAKGALPGAVSMLEAVASALARAGGVLSGLIIIGVLAITAVSVVGRYVLGSPVPGVDEGVGFLVVAIVMCGAAEALRTGSHIGIDLVSGAVGPKGRRFLDALAHLAVLVFSVLLFRAAWHTVVFSREFEAYSTGQLELPLWIPQSTMLLGAGLLGFVALAKLIRTAAGGDGR